LYRTGRIPDGLRNATIIMATKKRNIRDPENYRNKYAY
jgi:hypothetical protein